MPPGVVRSIVGLARACHPGPVVAVSAASVGYALAVGCTKKEAGKVGLAVFSGQLAIGWQNDWTDATRDTLSGRRDKPIPNNEVKKSVVGEAALIAGVGCLPLSMANGTSSGLTHLAAVASAASYNALLKSTPASILPYALSFSLLPVAVRLAHRADVRLPPFWAPAAAGALGMAAHLLNVLPDREVDRTLGVLGLPQRLSPRKSLIFAGALLTGSSGLISFGSHKPDRANILGFVTSLGLGAAALHAARSRQDRRAFRLVLALALLDVTELLLATRRANNRNLPTRS